MEIIYFILFFLISASYISHSFPVSEVVFFLWFPLANMIILEKQTNKQDEV